MPWRSEGFPELRPRQRDILHAVIRDHVASARPVASAGLVKRYRLDVSPATVRSELAELEALGLLTHPHTSAGRMPTDLGYRYFIESLMPQPDLRPEERVTLSHQFRQAPPDMAQWLRLAASALARVTAEAALATYDRALDPDEVVPPGSQTETRSGEVEHPGAKRGVPPSERRNEVVWSREIHYEGIEQILEQPEFEVRTRVREIVSLLHDRVRLSQLLPESLDEGEVAVTIGSEHSFEPLWPFSLVIGRYGAFGPVGYVGVVGPTRMDYQRTIGAVRFIGALMSDLERALGGR